MTKLELAHERFLFFSDAVFAIAITLLALEIKVPKLNTHDSTWLSVLITIRPEITSYVSSFLSIGLFWIIHYFLFTYVIEGFDFVLIIINLPILLTVVAIPFTVSLSNAYSTDLFPEQLYGGLQITLAIMFNILWHYVKYFRQEMINEKANDITLNAISILLFLLFVLSLGVAIGESVRDPYHSSLITLLYPIFYAFFVTGFYQTSFKEFLSRTTGDKIDKDVQHSSNVDIFMLSKHIKTLEEQNELLRESMDDNWKTKDLSTWRRAIIWLLLR